MLRTSTCISRSRRGEIYRQRGTRTLHQIGPRHFFGSVLRQVSLVPWKNILSRSLVLRSKKQSIFEMIDAANT
jgi:hypothetical protein